MMANVIDNSTRHFSVVVVTHLLLQITTYTKVNFNEKHMNFKDGYKQNTYLLTYSMVQSPS